MLRGWAESAKDEAAVMAKRASAKLRTEHEARVCFAVYSLSAERRAKCTASRSWYFAVFWNVFTITCTTAESRVTCKIVAF